MTDYQKFVNDVDNYLKKSKESKKILKKIDRLSTPSFKTYKVTKDTIKRLHAKSEAINRLTFFSVITHLENLRKIDTEELSQENLYIHAKSALSCIKVIEKFLNKTISEEKVQDYYVQKLHYMLDLSTDLFLQSYLKLNNNTFKYNLAIKAIEANISFVTS